MKVYELRLLEADGRTIAVYALNCLNDERAKESIFAVANEPYALYEVWRGMTKIAEGGRFICNGHFAAPTGLARIAALQ